MTENTTIEIAGAGPAGLAAASTLARAGRAVMVHEAQAEVGYRFKRDLQGLENWTTRQDALAALRELGIAADFKRLPCCAGTAFDAWGQAYAIHSDEPLFYMLERGPGPDTLDTALLHQVMAFVSSYNKETGTTVIYDPCPAALMTRLMDAYASPHCPRPSCFCGDMIGAAGYRQGLSNSRPVHQKSGVNRGFNGPIRAALSRRRDAGWITI